MAPTALEVRGAASRNRTGNQLAQKIAYAISRNVETGYRWTNLATLDTGRFGPSPAAPGWDRWVRARTSCEGETKRSVATGLPFSQVGHARKVPTCACTSSVGPGMRTDSRDSWHPPSVAKPARRRQDHHPYGCHTVPTTAGDHSSDFAKPGSQCHPTEATGPRGSPTPVTHRPCRRDINSHQPRQNWHGWPTRRPRACVGSAHEGAYRPAR